MEIVWWFVIFFVFVFVFVFIFIFIFIFILFYFIFLLLFYSHSFLSFSFFFFFFFSPGNWETNQMVDALSCSPFHFRLFWFFHLVEGWKNDWRC